MLCFVVCSLFCFDGAVYLCYCLDLFIFRIVHPPISTFVPYTSHFRAIEWQTLKYPGISYAAFYLPPVGVLWGAVDRKSTRLHSSHTSSDYLCLKKKNPTTHNETNKHKQQVKKATTNTSTQCTRITKTKSQ